MAHSLKYLDNDEGLKLGELKTLTQLREINDEIIWEKYMKRFKVTAYAALLIVTISSTSLAGTIVGARTSRTGTIVGARSGNIAGTRTGNIAGTRTGNVDWELSRRDSTETKLSSLISENIDGILRIFLTRTLF